MPCIQLRSGVLCGIELLLRMLLLVFADELFLQPVGVVSKTTVSPSGPKPAFSSRPAGICPCCTIFRRAHVAENVSFSVFIEFQVILWLTLMGREGVRTGADGRARSGSRLRRRGRSRSRSG